jgi:hypothetical protein
MAVMSRSRASTSGHLGAARKLRDPLLLFALPVGFALLLAFAGYAASWPIGFDFRGTLWEPARALLDGTPIYPEPTENAVAIGNPAVYPPVFILASMPLALLPVTVASWLWVGVLGACVFAALWIVGVRDWRCHVLALTSLVVVHGLFFGNLTLVLVLLVALAWRYRDRPRVAGLSIGVAVAAKLFVAPLLVWLLLTRRFRAAAWAAVSAAVLVFGSWLLIGFEGLADYPALLGALQDVYAIRSLSVATVSSALGASVGLAVALAAVAGLACLGLAAWFSRREDADRRCFTATVVACVVASPVVWPNYYALLYIPIALRWPRLALAWFFGHAIWLAALLAPSRKANEVCCRPADVTEQAWIAAHADPLFWLPAAAMCIVAVVLFLTTATNRRRLA